MTNVEQLFQVLTDEELMDRTGGGLISAFCGFTSGALGENIPIYCAPKIELPRPIKPKPVSM